MNTTKSRYPSWWAYYYLIRTAYFIFGVPFLLLCSLGFTGMMLTEPYIETDIQAYLYTYGSWLLLILPSLWLYMKTRAKKKKVQQVVQQIKESSPFAPTSDYEQLSFSKSCYFGIDIKNGTMLYVRIYPNNVMDVIGLDIHNFTRTVAEDGKLEIHTTYVSLPMIPLEISGISSRTLA
ncbi:plasmid IncI1-type surface exclusion protein ExcA, partial [Shigella sonnei]